VIPKDLGDDEIIGINTAGILGEGRGGSLVVGKKWWPPRRELGPLDLKNGFFSLK